MTLERDFDPVCPEHGPSGHSKAAVRIMPLLMAGVDSMAHPPLDVEGEALAHTVYDEVEMLAVALAAEGADAIAYVLGAFLTHIGLDHYLMELTPDERRDLYHQRVLPHLANPGAVDG